MAHQQTLLHANQHQILEQLVALSFNRSDAGQGRYRGGGRGPAPPAFTQPITPAAGHATQFNTGFGGRGRGPHRGRNNYARRAPPGFGGGNVFPLGGGFALPGGAFHPPPPAATVGQGYFLPPREDKSRRQRPPT
jgi:hypothetical protein